MISFCTLFDSNYLTRGLALYKSLEKVCSSFHLYVVAFNDECYVYLKQAQLPHLTVVSLKEFEDDRLLQIKSSRSPAEYCWTCTPSIILFFIKSYKLDSCTYIDADMIFYHDPIVLIQEMGENSILLSEHRYTKEYDQSQKSGRYCVQFMCFKNDKVGINALTWWRERCIEWCYARHEDGKFGDQKYLDDWLHRFKSVKVIEHTGGGLAPWNLQQFKIIAEGGSAYVIEKKSYRKAPLIFFHFHGVKFYTDGYISCGEALYKIDVATKDIIYLPYFKELIKLENQLSKEGVSFNVNGSRSASPSGSKVFFQYMRDIVSLLKAGNINYPHAHFFSKGKHNHFFKVKSVNKTGWLN